MSLGPPFIGKGVTNGVLTGCIVNMHHCLSFYYGVRGTKYLGRAPDQHQGVFDTYLGVLTPGLCAGA